MRTIVREDLGFYHSVLIGGIYEFEDAEYELNKPSFFAGPLKYCIDRHAALAVVVKDKHTEKAFYERVLTMDLNDHIQVAQNDYEALDEMATIEHHFLSILKAPWSCACPPWKIVILPLSASESSAQSRCLITFVFSHALGDGIGGLVFHRTLLEAFRKPIKGIQSMSMLYTTPERELGPPFDTSERLPISWGYLMAPLLGALLPTWLGALLGLKASVASSDAGTWTGPPMSVDPSDPAATRIQLLEIDSADVERALCVARQHGAKLTAVMHQLIIRALDKAVPDPTVTSWLSHTAVNMRPAVGALDDEMGLFVTGCFQSHPRVSGSSPLSEADWADARLLTERLAESATALQDQPTGLLRYVPNMRKWTAGKVGQRRDGSYDVSNLGAFSDVPGLSQDASGWRCALTKMAFSHSTSPIAEPLVLSMVSVKGGSLVCSVGWTPGSLGLPEALEPEFVKRFCASIRKGFKTLV